MSVQLSYVSTKSMASEHKKSVRQQSSLYHNKLASELMSSPSDFNRAYVRMLVSRASHAA